jgi:signal transduction histidine kinase
VKPLLKTFFLTLLIFAAVALAYSQGDDSPTASVQAFNQDFQLDHVTAENGLFGNIVAGTNTVILTDEQDEYPLGLHLEILEDKEKTWTINDVTSPELASQFVPSQEDAPNFGFTDSAFWVRFRVRNEADITTKWQLAIARTTNVAFMELYVPLPDQQGTKITKTGTYLPFDTRDVEHHQFIFNLPLPPGTEQTIHLRVETVGGLVLPMTLWSSTALAQKVRAEMLVLGIIYGVLLIMIGYNTIIFLFLRDVSYLYYVLFVAFFLLQILALDGVAHQYLWPNAVRWDALARPLLFGLGIVFALKFTASYLVTRVHAPKMHKVINFLLIGLGIVIALTLITTFNLLVRPFAILLFASLISMLTTGFMVWRRGYRPARFFLLAWVLFLAGAIVLVLMVSGFVPMNAFTAQSYRYGLMALALMLVVALADRINLIRQERENAQAETARKQQETLELENELNIALQASKEELEERVDERTAELTKAKEVAEATQAALRKTNNKLATVMAVSQDVVSTLELDALLSLILEQLHQVIDYHGAGILTFKDEVLHFRAYQGLTLDSRLGSLMIPVVGVSPLRRAMLEREPFIVDDVWQEPGLSREFQEATGLGMDALFADAHAWIGIPLIIGARAIGLLGCIHREPGFYQTGDWQLARVFANQVAIALENAQLYEQAQATAVAEERNRLARELHDSVTQTLFSTNVIAQTTFRIWDENPEDGRRNLEKLSLMTKGALAEMRTLLVELRPTAVLQLSLHELLSTLADAALSRSRASVNLTIEGDCFLTDDAKIALYRIAQEALNNITKHSEATEINVALICDQKQVVVSICDNGLGFDPEATPPGHFGLAIMRERAEKIGATLLLTSRPGDGTEIAVTWPNNERYQHD